MSSSSSPSTAWCSACREYVALTNFECFRGGKPRKTCMVHSKKKRRASDDFQTFLAAVEEWARESVDQRNIALDQTFDIDDLPARPWQPHLDEHNVAYSPLEATKVIVDQIARKGGHRFWHARTNEVAGKHHSFWYYCSQDEDRNPTVLRDLRYEKNGVGRDTEARELMERFACDSMLFLLWEPTFHSVRIRFSHNYHQPYDHKSPTQDVENHIAERALTSAPAEIYRELRAQEIPGWRETLQHQVYYRWQLCNSAAWRREDDPLSSANELLREHLQYQSFIINSGNCRALAFYVQENVARLSGKVKEIAIDETYGTNSSGNGLFAILAEVDGSGVPLGYMFVDVMPAENGIRHAEPGSMIDLLRQFLQYLRNSGVIPAFVGCDKDPAERAGISLVFPDASTQLCFWHAKRAIKKKLTDTIKTATQSHYYPAEAQGLIPSLEVCWGSEPTRRPEGDHRQGMCQCPSRGSRFEPKDRLESQTTIEREALFNMFSRHFNQHPLIPDQDGVYRLAATIHRECTQEAYRWCFSKGFFRLWAYLWVNWYKPEQWKLWARSSSPEIPVLKTTMIVESHWRCIKHDYLHRFNRPRVDLVVWILITKVIPEASDKLSRILSRPPLSPDQALTRSHRMSATSWRKDFRSTWAQLMSRDTLLFYHTDPIKWVCACPSFLTSRFLVCKHIVHCFQPVKKMVRFSLEIQRRRTCPFWVSSYLSIRDDLLPWWGDAGGGPEDETSVRSDIEEPGDVTFAQSGPIELEDSGDEDDDPDGFLDTMEGLLQTFRDQRSMGNDNFVRAFIASNRRNCDLADQLGIIRRQRAMPRTWQAGRHAAAMYFR